MKFKIKYLEQRIQEVFEFAVMTLLIISLILIGDADRLVTNVRYILYTIGSVLFIFSFFTWINRKDLANVELNTSCYNHEKKFKSWTGKVPGEIK